MTNLISESQIPDKTLNPNAWMRSRNALKASIESKKEDAKPPSLSTDPIYEVTLLFAFYFWVF